MEREYARKWYLPPGVIPPGYEAVHNGPGGSRLVRKAEAWRAIADRYSLPEPGILKVRTSSMITRGARLDVDSYAFPGTGVLGFTRLVDDLAGLRAMTRLGLLTPAWEPTDDPTGAGYRCVFVAEVEGLKEVVNAFEAPKEWVEVSAVPEWRACHIAAHGWGPALATLATLTKR